MPQWVIVRIDKTLTPVNQTKDYLANRQLQWSTEIGKALCLEQAEAEQLLPKAQAQDTHGWFSYRIESRTHDLENRLR